MNGDKERKGNFTRCDMGSYAPSAPVHYEMMMVSSHGWCMTQCNRSTEHHPEKSNYWVCKEWNVGGGKQNRVFWILSIFRTCESNHYHLHQGDSQRGTTA